jgi:glucose/arabinose dehydrogenase
MKMKAILLATTLLGAGCLTPSTPSAPVGPVVERETATSPMTVVATGLKIPWGIAFLPDGDLLVTERPGTVRRIGANAQSIPIEAVKRIGEGGLLGIALHPDFSTNHWVYIYLTTSNADGSNTNRVERYVFDGEKMTDRKGIIQNIPGAIYHDGGRLAFGPDGYLYVTTGDATKSDFSQDKNSLAGKILRVKDDGSIPSDNPFGTAVYSYGHRNPQGLTWDTQGRLWATEHGRSGLRSGLDELNLIDKGENYGWPNIEGDEKNAGMVSPVIQSGPDVTWAPAGIAYFDGSLFFGGLRGESLYEAKLDGAKVTSLTAHFKGQLGRIRAVELGPDGYLYLSTSNTDGRGTPNEGDDKIIRIDPKTF